MPHFLIRSSRHSLNTGSVSWMAKRSGGGAGCFFSTALHSSARKAAELASFSNTNPQHRGPDHSFRDKHSFLISFGNRFTRNLITWRFNKYYRIQAQVILGITNCLSFFMQTGSWDVMGQRTNIWRIRFGDPPPASQSPSAWRLNGWLVGTAPGIRTLSGAHESNSRSPFGAGCGRWARHHPSYVHLVAGTTSTLHPRRARLVPDDAIITGSRLIRRRGAHRVCSVHAKWKLFRRTVISARVQLITWREFVKCFRRALSIRVRNLLTTLGEAFSFCFLLFFFNWRVRFPRELPYTSIQVPAGMGPLFVGIELQLVSTSAKIVRF